MCRAARNDDVAGGVLDSPARNAPADSFSHQYDRSRQPHVGRYPQSDEDFGNQRHGGRHRDDAGPVRVCPDGDRPGWDGNRAIPIDRHPIGLYPSGGSGRVQARHRRQRDAGAGELRTMDLIIASSIFGVVLAVVLIAASSGGVSNDQAAELLHQVTRVDEDAGAKALMRQNPRRRQGEHSEFLHILYNLHLLRRLEEKMWQAGIYLGVAEMMLVILLLFGAGVGIGEMIWGDLLLA